MIDESFNAYETMKCIWNQFRILELIELFYMKLNSINSNLLFHMKLNSNVKVNVIAM